MNYSVWEFTKGKNWEPQFIYTIDRLENDERWCFHKLIGEDVQVLSQIPDFQFYALVKNDRLQETFVLNTLKSIFKEL